MKKIGALILGIATLGGVVAGFLVAGGPIEARREEEDRSRFEDLTILQRTLACDEAGATAPDTLPATGDTYCGAPILLDLPTDPVTQAAYVYTKTGPQSYSLCAGFHNAEKLGQGNWYGARSNGFDPETGCLMGRVVD